LHHYHRLNLTKVPRELKLILELLKQNEHVQDDFWLEINWEQFMELSVHHRVYPMLYHTLKTYSEIREIPAFVVEGLQTLYKQNTFHMLLLSSEMEQVNQLFRYHHIHMLILKGPTLGHELFGDISLRTSSDIDVLIPIEQLEKVESILLQQGYLKDDYIQTVLNDWKWRHHHMTFTHPSKGTKLEVHWRLHPGPKREPDFQELWSRKRRCNLINSPLYTLHHEDLFLYLSSHGARHGWSRLRWLLDIHQLANQELDWENVASLAKEYDIFHIGGQAMVLSTQLFETEILDERMLSFMRTKSVKLAARCVYYLESMIHLHADHVPTSTARYHKYYLFSLMSVKQKALFLLSFLFPYPEDAETLRLPKQLHVLYFPLRPFLWFWRKTRKNAV